MKKKQPYELDALEKGNVCDFFFLHRLVSLEYMLFGSV